MSTNTNNPFQTTPVEKKTTTTTTEKKLGSPIDERAGDWASSTMPALGPDVNKTSTTSTSAVFPPASSTTTANSAIGMNTTPLITPITHTNPSAHTPAFTSTAPHDAGLPGKRAVEPESFSRTTVASVPSQGTYAPSGPAFDQTHIGSETEISAGDMTMPSAAGAYETAKEVAVLAKDVALAANEQMREKVIPTVASYLPSAETTKQVAASAGETAVAAGAVVGQAAYNAGSAAVEAAKPYMPTAEQTRDAAINAGQATANAGAAAGQVALGATVVAGQAAANGAVAAGQALSSGAAVAGQTAANAGSAAAETTRNTGAAVADTTTNAAVSTKEGVASYIPEVNPINAVYNAAAAAGNAILSYLPGATTAPITSLPSEETGQNVHPAASGGVGTLPGPPGEFGVAILPDEKTGGVSATQAAANVQTFASTHTPSHLGGVGTLPGAAGKRGIAVLPEERNRSMLPSNNMALPGGKNEQGLAVLPGERGLPHPPLVQKALGETGPSTHTPLKPFGTTTAGGVGDLPGTPNESSVALLPDEKFNKSTPTATARAGRVGDLPGKASETSVAVLPDEKLNKPASTTSDFKAVNTSNSVHPTATTTTSKPVTTGSSGAHPNVDGRSHPLTKAEEKVFGGHTHHELGSNDDSKVGPAVPPKDQDTVAQPQTHGAATDVHRKPTLMDKVKGEAKVITGKLSHNEEKVDDGKRMMGKAIN